MNQQQPTCSAYCGRPSTKALELVTQSWSEDDEGDLQLREIEAIERLCLDAQVRKTEANVIMGLHREP